MVQHMRHVSVMRPSSYGWLLSIRNALVVILKLGFGVLEGGAAAACDHRNASLWFRSYLPQKTLRELQTLLVCQFA